MAISIAAATQNTKVRPNIVSIMISAQFHILLKYRWGPCITIMRRADHVYPQTYSIIGASAPIAEKKDQIFIVLFIFEDTISLIYKNKKKLLRVGLAKLRVPYE